LSIQWTRDAVGTPIYRLQPPQLYHLQPSQAEHAGIITVYASPETRNPA
jgi:hypothetical protein